MTLFPAALIKVNNAKFVKVEPLLANTGFYAPPLPTKPIPLAPSNWARFTNVTGLVSGVTKLIDELTLLYTLTDINSSVFAGRLQWIWDGTTFTARL